LQSEQSKITKSIFENSKTNLQNSSNQPLKIDEQAQKSPISSRKLFRKGFDFWLISVACFSRFFERFLPNRDEK